MAYSSSPRDMFRRAATHMAKILERSNPADLSVEQPTTFMLIINLKTAEALGLTIPTPLLFGNVMRQKELMTQSEAAAAHHRGSRGR